MKVHLLKKLTIQNFMAAHPAGKKSFENWLTELKFADWDIPEDIFKTFRSADLLGKSCNRIVFDIGGNNYRVICKYYFGEKNIHLFVCWIGTHAEYDELCGRRGQFSVNTF
jgi:mRNA interferase HigB